MTNQAIVTILDHLCNEARNSVHATVGMMDFLRGMELDESRQRSMAIGAASADQLLRSIDDVRDLLSATLPIPGALEQFDLLLCVGELIEGLNMASGKRGKHMVLDCPARAVPVTQNRRAVEEMLTRVLGATFKLSSTNEVRVTLCPGHTGRAVRLTIGARDSELAQRLSEWLSTDPNEAALQGPADVPFGIAVMVAGKYLRALEGTAELVRDSARHCLVAVDLPAEAAGMETGDRPASGKDTPPDALNILVAEDCSDSFALTELLLEKENVCRAQDGLQALHLIQRRRFDLVLMDVHMPGLDGYSAIHSIRDWETETGNARTPVVVLSSDDLETQRRFAAESGCSGFLRKPLRSGELTVLLDRLKEARRLVA